MTGIVTEYLFQLIAKQVEDRALVVWYDPERAYAQAVAELALPKTTIARYTDSFFRLRHEIDDLLHDGQPPRLVIYVPMSQLDTHSALIELEAAGVVMRPGQQPPSRNTKLAIVARNALRPILGDDQVAEIERQVETGKLSLADLNALADKGKDIATGILSLIFGTANPQEVALAVLQDERYDDEIGKKSAQEGLRNLLQVSFDIELPASTTLASQRERLARHVLLTDLTASLDDHVPSALVSVKVATSPGGVDACVRLARSWRNNRDYRESYVDGVLGHLRRGVRILSDHGIKTIILAADHGHLFADEIGEDMKIEAPGGQGEDLHRRVWVGVGGTSEPSYLRTSLSSLGVESEFDIATPWTFACFKSKGGARAYFHGGLSPQEMIVPVVVLTSKAKVGVPTTGIAWTLTPGAAKLTTRFFSVQIAGTQGESSLFGFEPPKVRIEVRANKKCVSVPVSASYGFEDATGEVKLKIGEQDAKRIDTNTVTVMIAEEITQKTVGVYLLDATTGAELAAPLAVEVAISM